MNDLPTFFSSLPLQNILTIGSFIFGIFSFIAFIDQRRSNKKHKSLYEFTKRNVDKEITEEQIVELFKQKEIMIEEITNKIPSLARISVLMAQSEQHKIAISEQYANWKKIEEELNNIGTSVSIDPNIEAIILDKIIPAYQKKRNEEQIKTRITIYSISSLIAGMIFPSFLGNFAAWMFAIPLLANILKLFSYQEDFPHYLKSIKIITYASYILIALSSLGLGIFLVSMQSNFQNNRILGIIFIIVFITLTTLSMPAKNLFNKFFIKLEPKKVIE